MFAWLFFASVVTHGAFNLLARVDFEPDARMEFLHVDKRWARIVAEPKIVISGKGSLLCDTRRSTDLWHACLSTNPKRLHFRPGWTYKVRLRYRVLSCDEGAYFYCIARTFSVPSRLWKAYDRGRTSWRGEPGREEEKAFTFVAGPRNDYTLIFGICKRGAIVLDDLEIREARPREVHFSAPKPLAPLDGQTLTTCAVSLSWFAPPAPERPIRYEIQLSETTDFASPRSFSVDDNAADVVEWFPDEPPIGAGTWFWRVRAINAFGKPGDWSKVRIFTLRRLGEPKLPSRSLSPEKPLFLFLTKDDPRVLRERWRTIPPVIRSFSGFRVGTRPATFLRFTAGMAKVSERIPCYLGVYGPNDIHKGRNYVVPLPLVEWAFSRMPFIEGAVLVEQYGAHESRRQYLAHLLPLAAKYSKRVIWAHKHGFQTLEFIKLGADPKWFQPISRYGRYFVPVWKMNGPNSPLLAHSCCLGFWLSGITEAWGVEPESWYWHEAGLGSERDFPPLCWGKMMLMGVAAGATCYVFEPPWSLWDKQNRPTAVARDVVFPLLSDTVRHSLIPSKREVLSRVKIGYVASAEDIPCSRANTYGRLWPLFKAVYGLTDARAFVPTCLPYFFVPVFPALCEEERIPKGIQVFDNVAAGARAAAEGERPTSRGALCIEVGQIAVATTRRARDGAPEDFEVAFGRGPVRLVRGKLTANQFVLFKPQDHSLFIHANAGEGCELLFQISPRNEITLRLESGEAKLLPASVRGNMIRLLVCGHASMLLRE